VRAAMAALLAAGLLAATVVATTIVAARVTGALHGNAHWHAASRLAGHLAGDHHAVGLGVLARNALPAADLAGHLPSFPMVASHLARDRPALADALIARDGAFFPHLARHPAANGLGRLAAGIATGITAVAAAIAAAVVAVAPLLEPIPQPRPFAAAGYFTAFPVAPVHAAADGGGDGLAHPVTFHHGALFAVRHADALAAHDSPVFGNLLVSRADARSGLRNALAAVGGVGFLPPFDAITGT
jgi:hypothetical protein